MAKDAPAFVTVGCKLPHGFQLRLGDKSYTLRGSNAQDAVNGAGLTTIPEDFWNEWSNQYRTLEPLQKGMIFAQAKAGDARAEAKEKEAEKTGLEQLDPNKISGVKPDDQMKASPAAAEPNAE